MENLTKNNSNEMNHKQCDCEKIASDMIDRILQLPDLSEYDRDCIDKIWLSTKFNPPLKPQGAERK